MSIPLRVLLLEDQPADAELMLHELRRAGFEPLWQRVESEPDYLAHLEPAPDIILADYSLPQFDALRALHQLKEQGLDIPFIVVTGAMGDEAAAECMKQGATDYLLKDRLARLGQAVTRALEQRQLRHERRQAETALQEVEKLKMLQELAGAAAHELNQPLQTIIGYVTLALMPLGREHPCYSDLLRIQEEAKRMAGIVQRMRELTEYRTTPYVGQAGILDLSGILDPQVTDKESKK